jgi:hypothetical protein
VSGPRVVLRGVRDRRRVVDLLVYDDVLAVVPAPAADQGLPAVWLMAAVAELAIGPRLRQRRERREAAPGTLPRGTRLVPLADVREVVVEERAHGAARLTIDGRVFDVPKADTYQEPWERLLGPAFGDRLTVV